MCIRDSRYLLQNLITRDFKLKYRRSVLGVAWSVLNPLLTCLVMWAVLDVYKRQGLICSVACKPAFAALAAGRRAHC